MTTHQTPYGREGEKHRAYRVPLHFWHHDCPCNGWTGTLHGEDCSFCGACEDEARRPQ